MKTLKILFPVPVCIIFFLGILSQSASSQEVIEVKNMQAHMSKGSQPCYVVEIPQADLKSVQQNLVKKLQENSKVKVKEVNHELVLSGVVKNELTKDSVNLYCLIIQKENKILLNMFVEIDSVFFSPQEDKTDLASDKTDNNIRNYLRAFAVEQYRFAVNTELKGQQEILKNLEKELEKLEKDEENMKKDNSSLKNDIEKIEREIVEIDRKIDLNRQNASSHALSMPGLVLDTDKKAAQEKEKELEKEKKQLEKSRSKAKDDISSNESKIEKNNKNIKTCEENQELKKEEIIKQKEVVAKVQAKLDGIN
jgi:predicted  nucleic acid-binding Zn-ribbon protein